MILVVDNYDSFTYNLVQYLGMCGEPPRVVRNDELSVEEVVAIRPSGIMLSPGPKSPADAGVCLALAAAASEGGVLEGTPLFGVCLGHQTLGSAAGAEIRLAKTIRHGKTSPIEHDGAGLFHGCPSPMTVVRYHSLAVEETLLGEDYLVTSRSLDDGEVMGIRHRRLPIEGVQFHPESVLSEGGMRIIENFVALSRGARLGGNGA